MRRKQEKKKKKKKKVTAVRNNAITIFSQTECLIVTSDIVKLCVWTLLLTQLDGQPRTTQWKPSHIRKLSDPVLRVF